MSMYTLVRESREGRQAMTELVHCIEKDAEETVCGGFKRSELRNVRNLSVFTGDSPICEECGEAVSDAI